jgi:hypothetical protein
MFPFLLYLAETVLHPYSNDLYIYFSLRSENEKAAVFWTTVTFIRQLFYSTSEVSQYSGKRVVLVMASIER